jgi:hypothetical protein
MPEQIQLTLQVQVSGGPQQFVSQALAVDAYDKLQVLIAAANGGPAVRAVEVQPGGAGQVRLLMVTASSYDPPLSYKVDGGAAIDLDGPLLLVGAGAVGAFSATQSSFEFTNAESSPYTVDILVGRDATP